MFLKQITLFNFKNYQTREFAFGEGVNALVGMNGSGKTTVLDAIHYLCLCKSYFNPVDSSNIKHGETLASIKGVFNKQHYEEEVLITLRAGQKKIVKLNQKEHNRLAEHIGLFPLIMITPVDHELITGPSEERRRLMDGIICQLNAAYLDRLQSYNKVLQQRNAMLKEGFRNGFTDENLLSVLNEQLVHFATLIFKARQEFTAELIPLFNELYEQLSDSAEQVSLKYISQLQYESMADLLEKNREKDRILQYTSAGIHKDDLELLLNMHPVKRVGSQGQQKSFLLALKLAQFKWIQLQKKEKPLLLLDDIFDKLDSARINRLLEMAGHNAFGQVFITDTRQENLNHAMQAAGLSYTCMLAGND